MALSERTKQDITKQLAIVNRMIETGESGILQPAQFGVVLAAILELDGTEVRRVEPNLNEPSHIQQGAQQQTEAPQ